MTLKNLKIASRFLTKHKDYTIINVLGLSLSLVCVLFISLYIYDELQYDAFHDKASRIYRVIENATDEDGAATKLADVNFRMATLPEALPDIENGTRLTTIGRANISNDENENRFYEPLNIGDQNFFNFFDFNVIAGSKEGALTKSHTAILTRSLAEKMFGTTDVINKTIRTDRDEQPYTITAVVQDFPANSHLTLNLIVSLESFTSENWYKRAQSDWTSNFFTTYILVKPGTDISNLEDAVTKVVNENRKKEDATSTFQLQALRDIHFYSADIHGGYNEKPGEISYLYIFGAVGLFILLISTINYINLSTSLSLTRGKEIGVKKVAGAARGNLILQFITESTLISFLSLVLALTAVNVMLPAFNEFTGKEINLELLGSPSFIAIMIGLALFIGLTSGSYPAFFLSRLKPVMAIKGSTLTSKGAVRQGLVVFQFALSITLIFGTLIAYQQLSYIQEKDLGFDQEQLVVLDINSGSVRRGFQTIKNEIAKIPVVKNVSVSSRVPGEWKNLPEVGLTKEGADETLKAHLMGVDEDFLSTFNIELLKGSNFRGETTDSLSFLINETAARQLGYEEPLAESITINSVNFSIYDEQLDKPFRGRIIGVVKDFHFQSLHQEITPLILAYRNNPIHSIDYFSVRLTRGDWQDALGKMEQALLAVDPNHLIEYNFLDQRLQDFYAQDIKRGELFGMAAGVSIGIACLGLFSLASFMTQQRTKEIGIRKVLGATATQIMVLLSGKYLKLVLLGFLVALPLAIWAANAWLTTFAYRISVGWLSVAAACSLSMFIALMTVGYKSLRAALMNPVSSLRSE